MTNLYRSQNGFEYSFISKPENYLKYMFNPILSYYNGIGSGDFVFNNEIIYESQYLPSSKQFSLNNPSFLNLKLFIKKLISFPTFSLLRQRVAVKLFSLAGSERI